MPVTATPVTPPSGNAYAAAADLRKEFDIRPVIDLSGDDNTRLLNTVNVETALDAAAAELDAVFRGREALPLASAPANLTRYVCALAMRALYRRRGSAEPDGVKAAVEEWLGWRELYLKRQVQLPNSGRKQPALAASDAVDGTSRFDDQRFFSPRAAPTSTAGGRSRSLNLP